jgi:hypothetical protein
MTHDSLEKLISNLELIANKKTESLDEFHETICRIGNLYDPNSIIALSHFFEDDSPEEDLMFAIIHTIEIFNDQIYIQKILETASDLYETAPQWTLVVFMRIINSDSSKLELVRQLQHSSPIIKENIRDIMTKINENDSIFLAKTIPVLIATS